MVDEVCPAGLRCRRTLNDGVRIGGRFAAGQHILNIRRGLLDVALNIHGETWGFGDGKTKVQRDNTRNAAKTDENTPHEVDVGELVGVIA